MGNYIYLETKEIRKTVTEIPQELWEKKGLLPYEVKYVSVEKGTEPTVEEGFVVQEDKVIETKIRWTTPPPVLTVEEYIEKKVEKSKTEITDYVNSKFSTEQQITAMFSLNMYAINNPDKAPYTEEQANAILDFCSTKVKNFVNWKNHIRTLTTKEEVDDCNWRTQELDDEGEIVSDTFWGE